jgi:hypothetical protein
MKSERGLMFTFWSDVMNSYLSVDYLMNEDDVALFREGDFSDDVFSELVDAIMNYVATEDDKPEFTDYEFI